MSPSPASCSRPLQRHPNVEKRVSLTSKSGVVSMSSCSSSSVRSETFRSPSRATSTSTSPTEESFSGVKDKSASSSQQCPPLNSTPISNKRHGVFLSPSGQRSTSRANPTKSVGTTLHDLGPVSPLQSPTRPKVYNNGDFVHHSSPRSAGDLPVTPVRRRTAKELIDHFERSGGSAPRIAPAMKPSATAPTGSSPRTPLNEARLNGPLPALPIKEPFTQHWQPSSPSRSPIRSLMNMVGLGKKGKQSEGDTGWKGRRKRSVSPTPMPRRTRALLAEDDETPIPPRPFESEAEYRLSSYRSDEDRMDAVTMRTVSDDHATPVRDIPVVLRERPDDDEENPFLRAGPLLYLINSTPEAWCNTQAILQTPYLTLSDPQPTPTSQEQSPSSPVFRSFDLRYCAVESLPCVILNGLAASPLGLGAPSPLIVGPRDIALYVFEISFPETGPGIKGKKERFATTSAWDRGKWVCHLWDSICAANVSPKASQDSVSPSGALSSVATGDDDTDDSDADLCTRRLQPPLRVVNVSKLSAFYDIDTIGSTKGFRLSSDESGWLTAKPPPKDRSPPPVAPNWPSVATSSTTRPPVPSNDNFPLRSAPLQKPAPYGASQEPVSKEEGRDKDRATKARSRSVPCSPSINNLGKMTLVQQRLARFESTKESSGTHDIDMEARGRSPRPLPIRPVALASSRLVTPNAGLSTPPISPTKATGNQSGLPSNRTATGPSFPNRTRPEAPIPSRNDPEELSSSPENPVEAESPPRNVVQPILESHTGYACPTSRSSLGKINQGHEGGSSVQSISGPGVPLKDSDIRRQSTATVSTASAHRLSGLTSLPGSEYPDMAPLFKLVRDTAFEQAAHVKALTGELEALRNEIGQVPRDSPVAGQEGKETTLRAIGRAERSEKTDERANTLNLIHSQLSGITTDMKNLTSPQKSDESSELTTELRETLPRHSQQLADIHGKLEQLGVMRGTLAAMNEASCADRVSWAQKLDGVVGGIEALKLDSVHERLDGIRASLAVLEAVAQSQQVAPTSVGPISAFRKPSEAPATSVPLDLSPIQEKLDALAQKQYGPTDEVINRLQEQVQSLSELCTKLVADSEKRDVADNVPPGGETAQKLEMSNLLEHLKEERTDQEKYFTDLNSWLQLNATQTSSQYHAISTTLQQVAQALAPLASEASSQDVPEIPGGDTERQTKGNVLQEIRHALLENNARNRANDNFLAAANHLIGAANAERQNLTALIATQREENERLLSHFANQITQEIRGQKHSFVDAMEKATALNVEGQLRELKIQISSQLVEMAKGVERLSEERKILEHQIAELLAFKSRFTPADYSDMPSISPGEYMPQVVPRPSQQRLQAEPAGQGRRPHLPANSQQPGRGPSRSPSPAPASKRPLPSPTQFHPMPNQTFQMGQRF